jgi:hypothetical protein
MINAYSTVVQFPGPQRPRLRALYLRLGASAPRLLHASRTTLGRALAGLPIRFGSALAVQQAMAALPTDPTELARVVAAARAQQAAEVVRP